VIVAVSKHANNGLTLKQEKFIIEILKGKLQRDAYRIAYKNKKSSDSTVDVMASQLLNNPKIKLRIEELKPKLRQKAEEKELMSIVDIIEEIESIAKSKLSDYIDFRTGKAVTGYDEDTGEPLIDYTQIVDIKDSRNTDTKNIQEISIGSRGEVKLKLYSRDKALYKLLDLYGISAKDKAKLDILRERLDLDKDTAAKKYW